AQFNHGLGLALAEAVLGWGARAYVESRIAGPLKDSTPPPAPLRPPRTPGEPFTMAGEPFMTAGGPFAPAGAPAAPTYPAPGADPGARTVSPRSPKKAARPAAARRPNLTPAVLTVSGLIVLPLVLWSVLGSGDDPAPSDGGQAAARTPAPSKSTAAG